MRRRRLSPYVQLLMHDEVLNVIQRQTAEGSLPHWIDLDALQFKHTAIALNLILHDMAHLGLIDIQGPAKRIARVAITTEGQRRVARHA